MKYEIKGGELPRVARVEMQLHALLLGAVRAQLRLRGHDGDDRVCIQFSGTDQTLGDRSGKRDSCAKSRFSGGAGKR